MSEPAYVRLWARIRAALEAREAWPEGHPTVKEAADHAHERLGTDLVRRFCSEYFQMRRYGGDTGGLSDAEAERLVMQIEALPVGKAGRGPTPPGTPAKPDRVAPATPIATELDEAVPYGVAELQAQRERDRLAEAAAQVQRAEAARDEARRAEAAAQQQAELQAERDAEAKRSARAAEAWKLYDAKDYGAAIPLLTELVERMPGDAVAWHALGFSHGEIDHHAEAIDCYRKAIALDPRRKVSFVNLAYHLRATKRYPEAAASCDAALRLDPNYALAWVRLGMTRIDQEDFAAALKALTQASAVKPDDDDTWFWIGRCHSMLKRPRESMEAYRRSAELKPSEAVTWHNLGQQYARLSEDQNAADAFEKAISLNQGYAAAWRGLGTALQKLGRRKEADTALSRAATLSRRSGQSSPSRGAKRGTWKLNRRALIPGALFMALSAASVTDERITVLWIMFLLLSAAFCAMTRKPIMALWMLFLMVGVIFLNGYFSCCLAQDVWR